MFHNKLGVWTLYRREVQRITRIFFQAVMAPIITALLYLSIFILAMGRADISPLPGVSYAHFLAGGLIMMIALENAFSSIAPALLISKIQGNIVDVLVSPLTAGEITLAFVAAGVTRGILVGLFSGLAIYCFTQFPLAHPLVGLFFLLSGTVMMASLGLMTGLWATKFDQLQMVSSFIMMPLFFLSGTFYRVALLPPFVQKLCLFDPIFYFVDGVRYGVIGHADSNLWVGACVVTVLNGASLGLARQLVQSGYNLRF